MLRLHNTLRLSLQTGSGRSLSSLAFTEIIALKGTPASLKQRLPLTKIVATIGPASENLPTLSHVVDAGMRLMRINFSHATYEEADLRMANLNKCFGINSLSAVTSSAETKFSNMRAVMLDTQGPEIRTGSFAGGVKEVELVIGDTIELTTEENVRTAQSASRLWISYGKLLETVEAGSRVLLDDGAVEVMVQSKDLGNNTVTCQVMNSGTLGNKKGVNMPGLVVQLPAMSLKDKEDIKWGITNDVDFIAASFVRKASDVSEIRAYCAELMALLPQAKRGPIPLIISKIESVEALVNFDSILEESDAIMVARGDLAVEIPMETIANVQKEIVKRCNKAGKPVIVATQMLETMQKNPRPTRAECTDVAN
ncbi:pyruvate kinase, partial [Ochromonadaceae sp. CCMP2298]